LAKDPAGSCYAAEKGAINNFIIAVGSSTWVGLGKNSELHVLFLKEGSCL
jgi:hypothetical protein